MATKAFIALSDVSSTARDLVTATLKIAASNHYMVGYAAETTKEISFDDFSDAHRDCGYQNANGRRGGGVD